MSRIVGIGAPPLTGKSTFVPILQQVLCERDGRGTWLALDNEVTGFSMGMREKCSQASGMALDSGEFRKTFNLQGQLDYQEAARFFARQGFNVLMPGPFEDLTTNTGGKPLYQKMVEDDFGEFDFSMLYVLLLGNPEKRYTAETMLRARSMLPVEAEIQRRRKAREIKGAAQIALDADKKVPDYYRSRAAKCLNTIDTFGLQLVRYVIDETPRQVAQRIADLIPPDK